MNWILRFVSLLGAAVFAFVFFATYSTPAWVEDAAAIFIRHQVDNEVRKTISVLKVDRVEKAAGFLGKKYEDDVVRLRSALEEGLPEKIANVVAEMRNLSCECRKKFERKIKMTYDWRIATLTGDKEKLKELTKELIQDKYVNVVTKLTRDLRIFSGANAALFLSVLIVSLVKSRATAQLLVPASMLLIATLFSSYCYVFGQNWFHTILFNDYVGYGYLTWVGTAFLFMQDISFNRSQVTTDLLNVVSSFFDGSADFIPC